MSHRQWLLLNNERHQMRLTFNGFFKDYDILLCPVAASAAFPHDHSHEGKRWRRRITVNNERVSATDQLFWAGYSGVLYLPSTVGPAGITRSRLPVGYQAIAAQGRDKTAIAFAKLVEKAVGGFTPPPAMDRLAASSRVRTAMAARTRCRDACLPHLRQTKRQQRPPLTQQQWQSQGSPHCAALAQRNYAPRPAPERRGAPRQPGPSRSYRPPCG